MISTTTTGFCRVTVVAPDGRIDVALPDDICIADLYPELLRLTGQVTPEGAPTGYYLVRRDGTVLDGARSLAAQRVLDGDLLSLRPFAESLPPAVYDDVSDAVASAVSRDRTLWDGRFLHAFGLIGGAVLLFLMAGVLWFADPVRHDMRGLPGIIAGAAGLLLAALAIARARVYDDPASAVALGLSAIPHVLLAGGGVLAPDAGEGFGRLQFLLGCAAVLIVFVIMTAAMPAGDAPFVSVVFAAAVGTLASFCQILTGASPSGTAAVALTGAIGAIAFLPGLSTRVARLPIGYAPPRSAIGRDSADADRGGSEPIDAEQIAAQARRGHELLLGLVGGCCVVVVFSAAVLGFSDSAWGQLLTLVAGLAMLLRARLFRYTVQVACTLTAGLAALALLVSGLALNLPADLLLSLSEHDRGPIGIRTLWLTVSIAAGAALLTGIALIIPKKGLTPFWARFGDLAESALLLALIPLALAVLDVYATVRGLTGNP
ncbi:type VII secretion integral membrane protein EccD [Streptomyces niger]|uniref:type VII secretion integral membrane protein EccD n=1 Tax=Streptomyces niger TaxID=66373 RepID=UPI00069AA5AA|nr:type VII secretion integral membrane protein EccD [Streptomyces niger]